MKSVAIFIFVGVVGLIGIAQATDYCAAGLCKPTEKHIGCKNSGGFAKTCPKERELINFDSELKNLVLKLHNTLRNDLAGGKVPNYKSAARMASMQWDDELAKLAIMHAEKCEFEHDECHSTLTFKHSGQNLAQTWYSGSEPTYAETIEDLIRSWWEEKKDANMDVIGKYPKNWDGDDIGHYTAMCQDDNTHVGCAGVKMVEEIDGEKMDSVMLTCDYAVTNMIGQSVYDVGAPASKCKTGKSPAWSNLCSSKETYP